MSAVKRLIDYRLYGAPATVSDRASGSYRDLFARWFAEAAAAELADRHGDGYVWREREAIQWEQRGCPDEWAPACEQYWRAAEARRRGPRTRADGSRPPRSWA